MDNRHKVCIDRILPRDLMRLQLTKPMRNGGRRAIAPIGKTWMNGSTLTRMIHERFCCNRRSAATTSLRPSGSPLEPSQYYTSTHRVLTAPRAGLATRLSDFATDRHE